jgi:hypothetical protein
MLMLPLRHGDHRNGPDIGLTRALEIHLVEYFLHCGISGVTVGEIMSEFEFADTGFQRFSLHLHPRQHGDSPHENDR